MPRTAAKDKPGSELHRDLKRQGKGGPKMHGRQWHDHSEVRDLERASKAGADAVPEAEGAGSKKTGTGRLRGGKVQGTQGKVKRKRTTPVGKGPKQKPGAAKHISQSGHRAKGRA